MSKGKARQILVYQKKHNARMRFASPPARRAGSSSVKSPETAVSTAKQKSKWRLYFAYPIFVIIFFAFAVFGQNQFEDRLISNIFITFERGETDASASAQFELIARNALGERYSAVRIRNALAALYRTGRIAFAQVEAESVGAENVNLRFVIRRKTEAKRVSVNIGNFTGAPVTEDDLLYRLNLIEPGTTFTEQVLRNNVDLIQNYLRERGYYNAAVSFTQTPLANENEVAVTFNVTPNAQARVEDFKINIEDFNAAKIREKLKLKPGETFSQEKLNQDVERIRAALREEKFVAPQLNEPRPVYDPESNTITIELSGKAGPTVNVSVEAEGEKVGESAQTRLLPVKREGTLDFSAIEEGRRRLENYFQEQGYFFASVTPVCSVKPEFAENEASYTENETEVLCQALSGADLTDRVVDVTYRADLNRRLKLVDIRIEGTDKLPIEEVRTVLQSQEASILGIIPFLGYGRGYTSEQLLRRDQLTITTLMNELGYRNAEVRVRQGVALNGEDLIITFVVDEGIPTRISGIEITGNTAFSDDVLKAELPNLEGQNFSRARARNGVRKLSEFYSNAGYYYARVNYAIEEVPDQPNQTEDSVKIIYTIENEGKKVFINRILISGNEDTKREAILKSLNMRPGEVLRSRDIFASEQNLYASDAFRRVTIKPEPAGERPDGNALTDIIINVEEQPARLITYGGGYSTDGGAFGSFDIRHFNLFGNLQQGGARVQMSRLRQIVQLDYINPRFRPDGENADGIIRFAPLTVTAQFQRDSTITRFFRSAFDRGTFGIVQRIDEDGNPIDEFGNETGDPTINRLTLQAETSRTISVKSRSILFARYKFEAVRLSNIESLLIKDLLLPDQNIRTSGFGANFVRDTRENCSIRFTLLETIRRGEPGEPCRYSPTDPTKGDYLTAEYNISAPFLGANIGFHKFQASYYRFYTFPKLKNTTLAGRAVLGLASVFSKRERFSSSQFPDLEGILPISERFFGGGSTTLRGFEFESAGPRVVIVPQGFFRNSDGEQVFLSPFTVPFGGNALAIVNLEARVPVSDSIRAVPFYDGGNVFRRVADIFRSPDIPDNDVFRQNLRARWTHTVGEFAVDYGVLLNPPRFLIPQIDGSNATFQPRRTQLHFRFAQAF
jgi:outer membrane protein insertion porin family